MNQLDECMYCGFDKDLTDEHIIPFGMGGDLILKKSSCKKCNEKTSKEELKVLRGFMYDGRLVGNLPSRRKKKRPKKINRVLLRKDGTESNKELLVSDGIAVIHLPLFSSPGLLAGQHPQEGIALRGIDTIHIGLENLSNLERAENVSGIKFGTRIEHASFCKVLSKIAYGYHVKEKGLFPREESPALQIMNGENTKFQHWIGSIDSPDSFDGLHHLDLRVWRKNDGVSIHMVNISLFHGMGGRSTYTVITRICQE